MSVNAASHASAVPAGHGAAQQRQPVRGLSREVLRWLQGLDLAYSVRNVQRDFASGFLVAEIFSRYDSSIHMHSYDNGVNIVKRKDNWKQLTKFFRKVQIPYTDEEVSRIIHYDKATTVDFLNRMYTLLTQRRVQSPPVRRVPPDDPPFAKGTASLALKQKLRDPEMTEISDTKIQEQVLRERLQQHEAQLRQERMDDPGRFKPSHGGSAGSPSSPSRQNSKILRGPQRRVGTEQKVASIQVRQVAVKTIDRNVAQMRATKEMNARDVSGEIAAGSVLGPDASSSMLGEGSIGMGPMGASGYAGPSVSTLLNEAVVAALDTQYEDESMANFVQMEIIAAGQGQPAAAANFERALAEKKVTEDMVSRVYDEISNRAKRMAPACLADPREYLRISAFLCTGLQHGIDGSQMFDAASQCFRSIAAAGRSHAQTLDSQAQDAGMALANQKLLQLNFNDFTLPKFLPMLISAPGKRLSLLSVAYSFCIDSVQHHKDMIRQIQQLLVDNQQVFLHCMMAFATLEGDALGDEELLDLYLYYSNIALGMPSPSLRAAALSVISLIAERDPEQAYSVMVRVAPLVNEETWWEVRAQLLLLAATLLTYIPADDERHAVPLGVVDEMLNVNESPMVLKAGLSQLSAALANHPSLSRRFVDVLCDGIRERDRSLLLSDSEDANSTVVGLLRLNSSRANGGEGIELHSLPARWDAAGVAQQVAQRILEADAQRLEPAELSILRAAVLRTELSSSSPEAGVWGDIFKKLMDYILVAFADPLCCNMIAPVLRTFIINLELVDTVFRGSGADVFMGTFKLIFAEQGDASKVESQQQCICRFLEDIGTAGPRIGAAVSNLLQDFQSIRGDLFESGMPLRAVLDNVAGSA